MTTGSVHYAGLLPFEPSDEPPPIRPTIENDPRPNRRPPLRKRVSRALSRFLRAFAIGVASTLAWQSYGDAVRQMIANSDSQLGWLAPGGAPTSPKAPDMIALAAPVAPQQHDAISHDLHSMQQSVDRIAASQEQIARRIDQIATSQEQMTRSFDQTTTAGMAQARSAKASGIKVEGRTDGASFQPTARPRVGDHRSEIVRKKEIVETTENGLSAPSEPYTRAPE